jgi:hypothetical protein
MIQYRFIMEGDRVIDIRVDRRRLFDQTNDRQAHAEWTRLEFHQCENCPLRDTGMRHCPVALDLEQIAAQFGDILSYTRTRVEVVTPERMYTKECDAQTALRSLLGLVMATSACPTLAQFRGLASSHLPFSTLEETLFRTAGAYLLKQYFIHKAGGTADLDLKGLDAFYRELQTINRCFKSRLDSAFSKDANLNAIGSLLYVSVGVSYSLEDNLHELQDIFCPSTL